MLLGCHRAEGSVPRAQCLEILPSIPIPIPSSIPISILARKRSAPGAGRKFDAQVAVARIYMCAVRLANRKILAKQNKENKEEN